MELKSTGTYIGYRLSKESTIDIRNYCKTNSIPMIGTSKDRRLHVTVIYSTTLFAPSLSKESFFGEPKRFSLFGKKKDDRILVLEIRCPEIVARHKFLNKTFKLIDDQPYRPHVTLTHVLPNEIILKSLPIFNKIITLEKEYTEIL